MRIHKIILFPVPADRKIWDELIHDGLIVDINHPLSQLPLIVDILDFDPVV